MQRYYKFLKYASKWGGIILKKVKKVVVDGREIGSIRTVVDVRDKEKPAWNCGKETKKSPLECGRKEGNRVNKDSKDNRDNRERGL